jgi:Ca2+-binding EF-hand superfamily protein
MTTRWLWALGFGVTVLVLAVVPGSGRAVAQQPGGLNPAELFTMLDANNDQVIERGEVPEKGRPAFERLLKLADKNRDGKVDQQEYRDLLLRARESMQNAPIAPLGPARFQALDKNGDGKVSREEFDGRPMAFTRIDADGDGFITREEAQKFRPGGGAGPGGPAQIGPRLKAMDKDGDGKVSREEFTGPAPLFDRIDRNKDGSIDAEEVRTFRPGGQPAARKAARPDEKDAPSTTDAKGTEPPK